MPAAVAVGATEKVAEAPPGWPFCTFSPIFCLSLTFSFLHGNHDSVRLAWPTRPRARRGWPTHPSSTSATIPTAWPTVTSSLRGSWVSSVPGPMSCRPTLLLEGTVGLSFGGFFCSFLVCWQSLPMSQSVKRKCRKCVKVAEKCCIDFRFQFYLLFNN
jgi:hypothetical protein